jgi:hypothetical protein
VTRGRVEVAYVPPRSREDAAVEAERRPAGSVDPYGRNRRILAEKLDRLGVVPIPPDANPRRSPTIINVINMMFR